MTPEAAKTTGRRLARVAQEAEEQKASVKK